MLSRLHEREPELRAISDALADAAAGQGRAVVVEGPAGIGKTSLLEPARDAAQARNFAVASARGSDLETAYAWGVVRQLFEPRLRGMSADMRRRTLAGAAALAGPVVLPDASVPTPDVDASLGVLHGLYWLVAALAAQRPQLLVVDDRHWADRASVRFLEFLANRLDALPGDRQDRRDAPRQRVPQARRPLAPRARAADRRRLKTRGPRTGGSP
jgi:AAA ATPase domain